MLEHPLDEPCPALPCSALFCSHSSRFLHLPQEILFPFPAEHKISREFRPWKRHFGDGAGHSTRKAQELSSSILLVMLDMDGVSLTPF